MRFHLNPSAAIASLARHRKTRRNLLSINNVTITNYLSQVTLFEWGCQEHIHGCVAYISRYARIDGGRDRFRIAFIHEHRNSASHCPAHRKVFLKHVAGGISQIHQDDISGETSLIRATISRRSVITKSSQSSSAARPSQITAARVALSSTTAMRTRPCAMLHCIIQLQIGVDAPNDGAQCVPSTPAPLSISERSRAADF